MRRVRLSVAYLIGLLFGVGISLSGMANPAKVLNFFDVTGTWDPSLAFVMGGAVFITFFGYRLVWKQPAPLLADKFSLPTGNSIDRRLVSGSLVFGIGWGLAGFCPGGALPALGTGTPGVVFFVAALLAGVVLTRFVEGLFSSNLVLKDRYAKRRGLGGSQ